MVGPCYKWPRGLIAHNYNISYKTQLEAQHQWWISTFENNILYTHTHTHTLIHTYTLTHYRTHLYPQHTSLLNAWIHFHTIHPTKINQLVFQTDGLTDIQPYIQSVTKKLGSVLQKPLWLVFAKNVFGLIINIKQNSK